MGRKIKCVVIAGLAGVGKSTISKLVAEDLGYVLIDKDVVANKYVEEMLKLHGSYEGDRESEVYIEQINPMEYTIMMDLAKENMEVGNDVILVAPFLYQIEQDGWFRDKFKEYGEIEVKKILIDLDEDTMYDRIIERNEVRDTWKVNNWTKYIEIIQQYNKMLQELDNVYVYDNTMDVRDNKKAERLQELNKWIKE